MGFANCIQDAVNQRIIKAGKVKKAVGVYNKELQKTGDIEKARNAAFKSLEGAASKEEISTFRKRYDKLVEGGATEQEAADAVFKRASALPGTEKVDKIKEDYEELVREGFSEEGAAMMILDRVEEETKTKHLLQLDAVKKTQGLIDSVFTHRNVKGKLDPVAGLQALISSAENGIRSAVSAESTGNALYKKALSFLDDVVFEQRGVTLDVARHFRKKKMNQDVIKVLMGEKVDNKLAQKLVKGFEDANKFLVDFVNENGGNIRLLEGEYYLPHNPSAKRINRVGRDAYVDQAKDLLKVYDKRTETWVLANTDKGTKILAKAWETLRVSDKKPEFAMNLNDSMSQQRIIGFVNADAYAKYHEMFGANGNDIYKIMTDHMQAMSRKAGLFKTFGNNPRGAVSKLKQIVRENVSEEFKKKIKGGRKDETGAVRDSFDFIDAQFNLITNSLGSAETHGDSFIRTFADTVTSAYKQKILGEEDVLVPLSEAIPKLTRTLIASGTDTSTSLMSVAMLSKTATTGGAGDLSTLYASAAQTGHPYLDIIGEITKLISSSDDRQAIARELGLLNRFYMQQSGARERWFGEARGAGFMGEGADYVSRASGLAAQPEYYKAGRQMTAMREFARNKNKTWEKLPKLERAYLEDSGVRAQDWDLMRSTEVIKSGGGDEFVDVKRVLDLPDVDSAAKQEAYIRFHQALEDMTERAIIQSTTRSKAALGGGKFAAGTVQDSAQRLWSTFMSFPTSFYQNAMEPSLIGRNASWQYRSSLLIGGIGTLALALQLKEIQKGNTPRDMTDPSFWADAILRSEYLSFPGSIVHSVVNGYLDFGKAPQFSVVEDFLTPLHKLSDGDITGAVNKQ